MTGIDLPTSYEEGEIVVLDGQRYRATSVPSPRPGHSRMELRHLGPAAGPASDDTPETP